MPKHSDEHKAAGVRTVIEKITNGWELSRLYAFYCRCQRTVGYITNASDLPNRLRCVEEVQQALDVFVTDCPGLEQVLIAKEAAAKIVGESWGGRKARVIRLYSAGCKCLLPVMEALEHCASKLGDSGLEKAELWLKGIAQKSDDLRNAEAVVYFISRKQLEDKLPEAIEAVRQRWNEQSHEWNRLINDGLASIQPDTDKTNHELEEAPPRFLGHHRDAFSMYQGPSFSMDATMLRTAEWVGIDGYAQWWLRLNDYLSYEAGRPAPWREYPACHLFTLCRSSLALGALSAGLGALARTICRREKRLDSVAIASAVVFCRYRAEGLGFEEQILRATESRILKWQTEPGAWPNNGQYLHKTESILDTAMAIHALASAKPDGWEEAAKRGSQWLLTKQDGFGRWDRSGIDAPFLTVLVLDALAIANGETWSTIKPSTGTEANSPSNAIGVAIDADKLATAVVKKLHHVLTQKPTTAGHKKNGRRGPKRIKGEDASFRTAVLAAWKKAKGAGVSREEFCEKHTEYIKGWREAYPHYRCPTLTVKRLENFQSYQDQRHRRAQAKKA